ncbi:hypothetical protein PENTCL1PPCAC_18296, partial [Pristionchus entomophagus]
ERRHVFVPSGGIPSSIPYPRVIVTPNGRQPIPSPYAPPVETPYARPPIQSPFPVRQIVIRRPFPVNPVMHLHQAPCVRLMHHAPPGHLQRMPFDPYPMAHDTPRTVYRSREVDRFPRVQVSHVAPPDEVRSHGIDNVI